MLAPEPASLTSPRGERTSNREVNDALLELRVKRISYEAESINAYELVAPSGGELPSFTAGSHIDLHLPNGMVRSYSLLNDPAERHRYMFAVNRDDNSRGGSRCIHDRLKVGDRLTVSRPRNTFALHEDAESSVLIAGGIGITPLLSMIRRLNALGRKWTLAYAARSREAAAFLHELRALHADAGLELNVDFDDERGGKVFDLAAIVRAALPDAHLYCCGPQPMLAAFEAAVAGWPADQLHVEYFQPRAAAALDGGFSVRLARSGRTIAVRARQTILDALLDAGVSVPYACCEGLCGTCETRLLDGVPDHRDQFLSAEERESNRTIMICCSGAKSDNLVLDL